MYYPRNDFKQNSNKTTAVAKHTAKDICHVFCISGLLFREGLVFIFDKLSKSDRKHDFPLAIQVGIRLSKKRSVV